MLKVLLFSSSSPPHPPFEQAVLLLLTVVLVVLHAHPTFSWQRATPIFWAILRAVCGHIIKSGMPDCKIIM